MEVPSDWLDVAYDRGFLNGFMSGIVVTTCLILVVIIVYARKDKEKK